MIINEKTGVQVDPARLKTLRICDIAVLIRKDWPNEYFAAVPYLDAMLSLDNVDSAYGADTGRSIVTYFLSNAATYRGPVAKAIKAELKRRLGR